MLYKALRSAGGGSFAPRAASAARDAPSKVERNANIADRDVDDFRCKLTT